MNRILLIAALATSITAAQAQQQNPNGTLPEDMRNEAISGTPKPQGKTNTTRSRLIARAGYFNPGTGTIVQADTMLYAYSHIRGGDLVTPIKADTVSITSVYTTPVLYKKEINTYDTNNNMRVHLELFNSNGAGGTLENSELVLYGYDTHNRLMADTGITYNSGAWDTIVARTYTYDASGNLLTRESLGHDMGWDTYPWGRVENVYNTASQLLTRTYYSGNRMAPPAPDNRVVYTYNSGGLLTATLYQVWNATGSLWADDWEEEFTYNAAGLRSEAATYSYRTPGRTDTTARYLYTYDAAGNLAQTLELWHNLIGPGFKQAKRHTYTSNSYGQTTSHKSETSDGAAGWTFERSDALNYYYYEDYYDPTTVAKLQQQGGTLKVYPVPASNSLHVDINWDTEQSYTLTVADMMGRVVYSEQRTVNSGQRVIDVSALPAGAYNIILKGDKGGVQHSRFTVVR
ncbi:MAG: T9SS type A sorting domain-containing protein [Sphingobacteriales bacterium]|nr:MAG: T9SS type A sorting domain-containing protein [Sphingobacteriales bacterium]